MLQEDIERELNNWALWRAGGLALVRGSLVTDYAPVETRYREAVVPVLAGDAVTVEAIVLALQPKELREALFAQYLRIDRKGRRLLSSWNQGQIARALEMSTRTFERQLELARKAVGVGLTARRQRTKRLRSAAEA